MIPTRSMTVGDAVQEILARAASLRSASMLDYGRALQYLRDARREVAAKTLAYREWAYEQRVDDYVHGQSMPADYIRVVRVVAYPQGFRTPSDTREARLVDPREWCRVVDAPNRHAFAGSTELSPVYMIWAPTAEDDENWGTQRPALWLSPSTYMARIVYVASYDDQLFVESQQLMIPVEYENIVISTALLRYAVDAVGGDRTKVLREQIQREMASLGERHVKGMVTEAASAQAIEAPQPTGQLLSGGG